MKFKFFREPDGQLHCQFRHDVKGFEVRQAFENVSRDYKADGDKRHRIGRTKAGKTLFIVYIPKPDQVFIITAWPHKE